MPDPPSRRELVKTLGAAACAASWFPDHLCARRAARRRYLLTL